MMTDSESVRWWQKVIPTDGCWHWVGHIKRTGYGVMTVSDGEGHRQERMAHRLGYEILIGAIPDGLEIDHLCRNRACVNPAHLQAVSTRENVLRGEGPPAVNARKQRCIRGHSLGPDNVYDVIVSENGRTRKKRICRQCSAIWAKRSSHQKSLKMLQENIRLKISGNCFV